MKSWTEAPNILIMFISVLGLRIILFSSSGKVLFMEKIMYKILPIILSSLKGLVGECHLCMRIL